MGSGTHQFSAKYTWTWPKNYVFVFFRALVRAGGTSGMPPVNFSQWVAATRQIRQKQQGTLQFSVLLYVSTHCSLTVHPSFETHGEGPGTVNPEIVRILGLEICYTDWNSFCLSLSNEKFTLYQGLYVHYLWGLYHNFLHYIEGLLQCRKGYLNNHFNFYIKVSAKNIFEKL